MASRMERCREKGPAEESLTDRELKQWELQTVYDDGEGYTADLQFVANSFYALRFCTPEGYTAMLTFARADNTVKSIDLYAPGM